MRSALRLIGNKMQTALPGGLDDNTGKLPSAAEQESAEEVENATNATLVKRLSQVLGHLSESDRKILLDAAQRIVKK